MLPLQNATKDLRKEAILLNQLRGGFKWDL